MTISPLSPTPRTVIRRSAAKAATDRAVLHAVLAEGLVAHVGLVTRDGHPVVIPSAYAFDPEGPDRDGTLYLHGSVAAVWLRAAREALISVAVTLLDGIVLARSGFHHSMNHRSAVVIGSAREVVDEAERRRALDLVVDQVTPGRAAALRPSTRKELAATLVLAVPLHEASVKVRAGDPVDEPEDHGPGVWAGVIPLRTVADEVVDAADSQGPAPEHVIAQQRKLSRDR